MDPASVILDGESQVARRIALGIHVTRPRPLWWQAIPGMFLVDFLQRTSLIRRFREAYLRPRRQALLLAVDAEPVSVELPPDEAALRELLVEHYRRLLAAEGRRHQDRIRSAYGDRATFDAFLRLLDQAEEAIDLGALEKEHAAAEVGARVRAEREQVRDQRDRYAREIFLD